MLILHANYIRSITRCEKSYATAEEIQSELTFIHSTLV